MKYNIRVALIAFFLGWVLNSGADIVRVQKAEARPAEVIAAPAVPQTIICRFDLTPMTEQVLDEVATNMEIQ
jgi:hypothetical protein